MEHRAEFINASQKIEDEISRLNQGRTSYNPFVNSSDLKIQILNRLLQVMWAPESFSKEELRLYFKAADSDQLVPKTMSEIIDALLEDTSFSTVGDPAKIIKVPNKNIINQNRNVFTKNKISKSQTFFTDLKTEFQDEIISPPSHFKYKVRVYKDNVDMDKDVGSLFIRWDEDTKTLHYKTINPQGNIVTNQISEETLHLKLGARFNAFHEAALSNKTKRFLEDILLITTENGDTQQISPTPTFKRILYLGDSLTDRGEMYDSILGRWSGLIGTSPHKSFSNGPVWAVGVDNFMAEKLLERVVAESLGIHDYKDKITCTNEDRHRIEETILNLSNHVRDKYKASFKLDDNSRFTIKNDANQDVVFSITRAIGGLTAYNYAGILSWNIVRTITRFLLSTLASQVKKLLKIEENTPQADKDETIIHILAGANDLVTVNARPSHKEVDRAVDAIIDEMETLWTHGFKRFAVSDLPDLSKTPRYQALDRREQINAKICTEYYNKQLAMRLAQFRHKYPSTMADIFSLHDLLQDGINSPSKYGFSTKYELFETNERDWSELNYHSQGCGFYRNASQDNIELKFGECAYFLQDYTLTYIDKTQVEHPIPRVFVLTDEELKKFNQKVICADAVKMLPENKLAKISSFLTKKAARENTQVLNHFKPSLNPSKNRIYYQLENDTLHIQVMDCYERLRKGTITKEALKTQINGCALLKSTISPVDDLGRVRIDIPSASAFVRFEDKIYYIHRSTENINQFESQYLEISVETLDEFDAHFKPWYASKQLSEKEFTTCCEMLDNHILPRASVIENFEINRQNATLYIPYIQAILAQEDYLIARGDLFTPAQNTKAFKRYLEESGPILPGDVMPTSNKAFNDDLHPLGDFGAIWANKFFNEFLLKHYQFKPDATQFMGFLANEERHEHRDNELQVVL